MRGALFVLLLLPAVAVARTPLERASRLEAELLQARESGADDRMTELLVAATEVPWPASARLDHEVITGFDSIPEPARRRWARDRMLPILAGELETPDGLVQKVFDAVAGLAGGQVSTDLAELERARALYARGEFAEAASVYATVARTSSLWPDALRERSWTLYRLARPDDALGGTVSLRAPYFPPSDHAEGRLLEATVLFDRCRYEEARAVVDPLLRQREAVQEEVDVLMAIRRREPPAGDVGRRAWAAPLVSRVRAVLDAEPPRDPRDPIEVRRADLEVLAASYLQQAMAEEIESQRALRERALRVRYESLRAERILRERGWVPEEPRRPPPDPIDDDEVVWEFDGTWWRDELGSYRYAAGSACPPEVRP